MEERWWDDRLRAARRETQQQKVHIREQIEVRSSAAMRAAYDGVILPALEAFAPEFLLISAGFDAHEADPLAGLEWQAEDYAWLTRRLCDLAGRHAFGRIVSTLEGGYDLAALQASVAAHVGVLEERGR